MKQIQISYCGKTINVTIIRKKVKNINLRVKISGEVIVTANNRVSEEKIINFVQSKSDFIIKHLERFKDIREKALEEEKDRIDKSKIKYLGKLYNVKFQDKNKNQKEKILNDTIILYIKNIDNEKDKEKIINNWYRDRCLDVFNKCYIDTFKKFKKYNIEEVSIVVRKMKSKWGSCMPIKRKITLNSELIKVPYECIEFVMAHELAHLVEPNHSKDFYKVLDDVMKDWKCRKEIIDKVYLK
ncbi:SprT family zinc-dependent metalloprotease [Clostridium baratii]|uniref:M48 family metallopeptidase n=1 Tax=Clostridium baratii TaxID=1561 RepID=UPI0030D44022